MDLQLFRVRRFISDIKRRWRIRALKQGLALTLFSAVIFLSAYLLLNYKFELPPIFQGVYLAAAGVVTFFVFTKYILLQLFRKLDDKRVALLIEEKVPGFHDRINSAAELGWNSTEYSTNHMLHKLVDDAAMKTQKIDLSTVVDRTRERILWYSSTALTALLALFIYSFMDDIRTIVSGLEISVNPVAEFRQEFLTIIPGNVEIEKGDSQEIVAELKRSTDDNMMLHYRLGEGEWNRVVMDNNPGDPVYLHRFSNIQEPVSYFVELGNDRTREYKISIYEFPKVSNINLTYRYPDYTGLPPRVEENAGGIRGLKQSVVTLDISTEGRTISGELVFENGQTTQLDRKEGGRFSADVTLEFETMYHINLTDNAGKNNKFPEEYLISPVDDEPPVITITDPRSDVRANPVEEVLLSVNVSDDFGIKDVRLNYTLNGENDSDENLIEAAAVGKKSVDGAYIFYLEDFVLQAGDVISYYVDAVDNFPERDAETSDMYFIEIIPLDSRFRQMSNPGGGGGGGQPSQVIMSQQKIITATWNLLKRKDGMTESEFNESLNSVMQAQSNLKENIEQRINSTAFSTEMTDEENQKIVEYLRAATEDMGEALDELGDEELRTAVREEQQALTDLLRADALNREKQVRLQNSQQSGGSGGGSNERITELMDLELDIRKNKYEMEQQRQQQAQQADETLRKLQELARRQEQLMNNQRRMMNEEEQERELDRLRRDQEQLRQQAEELSNQLRRQRGQNNRIPQRMQENLDRALENMEQASRELDNNNLQQSMSQQQQAINELQRMQEEMQMSRNDDTRAQVDEFVNRFRDLKRQEDQLAEDLRDTYREAVQRGERKANQKDLERLLQKRNEAVEQLEDVKNKSVEIEREARSENPEISTSMRNFRRSLDRESIERSMEESKIVLEQNWLMYANMKEEDITRGLENIEEQVRQLEGGLPLTEEEELMRALRDTRELLTRYDEIMESAGHGTERDSLSTGSLQSGQQQDQELSREQQQESAQGQQRQGNRQQGSQAPGRGNADSARLQRQLEQMNEMLDNMERSGGYNENMRQALRSAESAVSRAHNTGVLLDEGGEAFFRENVFNTLSRLELDLLRQIDAIEMEKKLYTARKADVPPEYRKLVEKYYESIARTKKQ